MLRLDPKKILAERGNASDMKVLESTASSSGCLGAEMQTRQSHLSVW